MAPTMTLKQAQSRRAEGRRKALRAKRALGLIPDLSVEATEPAPHLPALLLDGHELRCLEHCGALMWLDRESIIGCRASRARWVCSRGHDGWVRLEGLGYDEGSGRTFIKGKHYHYPEGA